MNGLTAHRAAVVLSRTTEKKVKQKVGKLHFYGCGEDIHWSCLERWTKVKKLIVPMRNRMSNLMISRSDA